MAPAVWITLALLGFCIFAEAIQQLCFRVGAARTGPHGEPTAPFMQPLIWAGAGIWCIESVAWLLALGRAPLTLAYPIMSLTYVATPLAGIVVLRERLTRRQFLGAFLILAGVVCVAAAEIRG